MTIVLDSLRPNPGCEQQASSNDRCEVEATFHTVVTESRGSSQVQRMWDDDRIVVRRELRGNRVVFSLSDARMHANLRPIMRDHRFDVDLALPDLQAAFDRSSLVMRYVRRVAQDYLRDHPENPEHVVGASEAIADFALVGNIVNPDGIQLERNTSLYRSLVELPQNLHRHIQQNILLILSAGSDSEQTNRSRWSAAMNGRFDRLVDIMSFSQRVRAQTNRLNEDGLLSARLRSFLGQTVNHLYSGQPSLDELTRTLRSLTLELYRNSPLVPGQPSLRAEDRYNLYRIMSFALEPLRQRPPFSQEGPTRDRLERLFHWVRLPQLSEDLEYSVLPPQEALQTSVYNLLSNQTTLQAVLRGVNDVIGPPFLNTDWLRTNGYLRDIVNAIASTVRVEGANENITATVDMPRLRQNLDGLFSQHTRDHREFVAGALAVLRYLFGARADHRQIRAFWNGTFREIPFRGDWDRAEIRALHQSLVRRVQRSLNTTERLLPAAEGVLCALGVAGSVADSLRIGLSGRSDAADNVLMGASGFMTGLGCTPLIGRAVAGAPQNAWLRDGILGGTGALTLGTAGALIPFAFRPPETVVPPRPIDGRNPGMGHGP